MTNMSKKGIALILFGILVSIGPGVLAAGWYIGLPIGLCGLIMVFNDKSEKQ